MSLLNDDQRRRLDTHLGLLESDLDTLGRAPDLTRAGAAADGVRAAIAAARHAAAEMRAALTLPPGRAPGLGRRIAAVAEVWAARIEDLRARRLTGYGAVHPELAQRLDPRVTALRERLEDLARAAAVLPEGDA